MHAEQLIVHLDPAIGSTNLGDSIISEAVAANLGHMFPDARIVSVASRDIGKWSGDILKRADLIFFGGSNALSSNPVLGYRQFAMGWLEYLRLSRVILFGVGWWQYQTGFGPFSRALYRRMLERNAVHAVRDEYTLGRLRELGFDNVLNTACPTMWGLKAFEAFVEDDVVVTLTDYNRNHERDRAILESTLKKFSRISFWPQGTRDMDYLQSFAQLIDTGRIMVLKPTLAALDQCLEYRPCYVGTRLHAGIRALQRQCPSYIVPIDNRALEIAKTENLVLANPELQGVEPGAGFRFVYAGRAEIRQFTEQFC